VVKSFWKLLFILLFCAIFFKGEASAAWLVSSPYTAPYAYAAPCWPSYGYYPAGGPVAYAPPVYAGVPVHYYAPPARVYVGRPVYYAPSGVYVRPRVYTVYPSSYYPRVFMGY
jgi:hypothetical protein